MTQEIKTVIEFCLDHAPQASLRRQVLLYRGLAEFCGDAEEAAKFRSLAEGLEKADQLCREFAFHWKGDHQAGKDGQ